MGIRDWKAKWLYNQTKDPYYVKDFLGHKSLKNTEIYINIENTRLSHPHTNSPSESSKSLKKSKNCLKETSNTSAEKAT